MTLHIAYKIMQKINVSKDDERSVLFQSEEVISSSLYKLPSASEEEFEVINANINIVPAICSTKYMTIPATIEKPILFWLNNCPMEILANTINK